MRKKAVIISIVAGIFILCLCVKSVVGGRAVPAIENAAVEEKIASDGPNRQIEQEKTESEPEEQEKTAIPEMVNFVKPVVKLNGQEGELRYDWDYNSIRIDADTLLLASDCYFSEKNLQQKVFFLAEAPYFLPREIFRQDDKEWHEESDPPGWQERRMKCLHSVDGGYIYEMDGVLYFLDKNLQAASPLCDLHQLMGDFYLFSPDTYNTCDVTADTSRMLACMDDGLYEYNLVNGKRKLLKPAFFAHRENVHVEGDCSCGERDFEFSGPVEAEYGPDGQSYAFLTGTEEAAWGDITGVVLRSGEGETLYQKNTEYVYDLKWAETGDTSYLAVFYKEYDGKEQNSKMDRVDVNTGEIMTFKVPEEIFWGEDCVVAFLDEDTLFYFNYEKQGDDKGEEQNDINIFEIYRLSSGQRQDFEIAGEVDWEMLVFDRGSYMTYPVRYPKQ